MATLQPPELEPLPLPPEPGLLKGWGRKLEATLLRFLLTAYNTIYGPILRARETALRYIFDAIEEELKPVILPLLDRIDAIPNLPPEVKRMTQHLRFSEPLTFAAIAATVIVSAIVGLCMGLVQPFSRRIAQEVDHLAESGVMPVPQAFGALKRGSLSEHGYLDALGDAGWSTTMRQAWEGILPQRVPTEALGHLKLREVIDERKLRDELERRGYATEDIGYILRLLEVIPPLPDIIRMAVREAFTPDVVRRFQLHAELPGDMIGWAKKQGLSEEWARAYWAAHWELPSLQMGLEMFHRTTDHSADPDADNIPLPDGGSTQNVIGQSTLDLLLRTHDISPFWRDKVMDISYSPYTRVDVRRMYESGVLGVGDVYRSYRDIGYDDEKATKMTEFTIALSNSDERDLTKAEILTGYKIGLFYPEEAHTQIMALGYSKEEADYYLAKIRYELWQAEIKDVVKYLGMQYVANQIDQSTVYSELGKLNLPSEQINRYIREWDVKRSAKTKTLTSQTLVKFLTQGVITDEDFANEMSGIGYSNRYIEWFLNSIHMEGVE